MQTIFLSWFAKYFLMMTCLDGDHKQLHLCLSSAWSYGQMIHADISIDCWHAAASIRQAQNWSRSNKSCWIAVMKSIFWVQAPRLCDQCVDDSHQRMVAWEQDTMPTSPQSCDQTFVQDNASNKIPIGFFLFPQPSSSDLLGRKQTKDNGS